MTTRSLRVLVPGAALFVALGLFVASRLELATGVTHFLSGARDVELAAVSAQIADSALTRTMILSIEASDIATAIAAAREWEPELAGHPEVAALRSEPGEAFGRKVFEIYFPRRYLLLASEPEAELPERFSEAGLRAAARDLRRALALPEAEFVEEVAAADPLLAFPALLRRFEAARLGDLDVRDGHLVSRDASAAILFVTTVHSAFDSDRQAPFQAFLEQTFAELDRRYGGDLTLERSGVHRFAVASEQRARRDMARISGISLAGIAAVFVLLFGSLRLLAISLLPLAGGVLVATAAGIAIFGELHLVTLVFGSTLIGVCIDYPIHLVNHHMLVPADGGPSASLRQVRAALTMGALTTVAGFTGLAWSDFPGVREIGVFAAVGVMAALGTTVWMLPPLLPRELRAGDLQRRCAAALGRAVAWLTAHRRALAAVPLAFGVVCAAGLPRVVWQDDVFELDLPLEPAWAAEDARVRARVGQVDVGRFVVAFGPDEESALQRNEAVYERLEAARAEGVLGGFRSLHAFLFSRSLQERNAASLAAIPDLPERVLESLEAEGFRPEQFRAFADAIVGDPPEPLQLHDLLESPLRDFVAPFHVELADGVAFLTFLRDVRDVAALKAALEDLPDVHLFDQRNFLADLYGSYRERTSVLILVGLLAVIALLQLRYRRARLSLAAAAPALLAAASTLALLALSGIAISLLHLLALLLVMSFGVDYSIFLLETRSHADRTAAAMLSLTIACISTCLAFGLLALSAFPALRALGATTGLGVLLSLVLAPTALVLAAPRGDP
jgi:predicted exporter